MENDPGFRLTLDLAQLVMLGGLIWGLAQMSASVKQLRRLGVELTEGLKDVAGGLAALSTRVTVVETRYERRRQ